MLDDSLLMGFMSKFFGYGNYRGAYWFIGMEEGGGDTFAEISRRLSVWKQRGRHEVEDLANYHIDLGIPHWFAGNARLQPTWAKLIRVLLSTEGKSPTREEVRDYQKWCWARNTGEVCLLELLPLPSPSTQQWLYAQHSELPELANRTRYRERWSGPRLQALRQLIATHQPRVVIFYGMSYREYWSAIAGADLRPVLAGEACVHRTAERLFMALKHPATRGVSNAYFHEAGRYLREANGDKGFS